jgi:hypothetical protein
MIIFLIICTWYIMHATASKYTYARFLKVPGGCFGDVFGRQFPVDILSVALFQFNGGPIHFPGHPLLCPWFIVLVEL